MNKKINKIINKVSISINKFLIIFQNLKKIIATPYWFLFTDYRLNNDIHNFKMQKPMLIAQDENWKVLSFGNFEYFWPVEFDDKDLNFLYVEVFAPSEINAHAYENRWVKIKKDDWVIDAGASEGFFIRYALLKHAKVLAIEPIPRLAEALKLTFQKEIIEGKLIILNMGLGEKAGVSQLQMNQEQICSSIVSDGIGENVEIISLDEIIDKEIIPSVQFIKMDIEGGEIAAICGAKKMLREFKPELAIAVYHEFDNALILRTRIRNAQPSYKVKFRGVFDRDEMGLARPYMLLAR